MSTVIGWERDLTILNEWERNLLIMIGFIALVATIVASLYRECLRQGK